MGKPPRTCVCDVVGDSGFTEHRRRDAPRWWLVQYSISSAETEPEGPDTDLGEPNSEAQRAAQDFFARIPRFPFMRTTAEAGTTVLW